jgi:hypothetical protein
MNNNFYRVEARYTPQRIPQYRGNPLIEALPPIASDEELVDLLFDLPEFDAEQRGWLTEERMHMVSQLSSFLQPLERHIRLARALDTMIRSGYVGRAPSTVEHVAVFQDLYEAQKTKRAFKLELSTADNKQLSSSLIGMSGLGKTTAIRRILRRYPQVIYHPAHHIDQIPWLHIEAPHDGMSMKGLAASLFRKIDQLVPDAGYYDMYMSVRSASGEVLMNHAALTMHKHFVGVLVVDEIQNLANKGTSKETLMSALVTASNQLGVPIVFVGTNKAHDVLGLNYRQGRRSVGHGFPAWPLFSSSGAISDENTWGEWEQFLTSLWTYQWIRKPVPLTQPMADTMTSCSQKNPDIAIKLFACAQWRAMLDDSETFSVHTIVSILEHELSIMRPMIDAMRTNDTAMLRTYDDIPLVTFGTLLDDLVGMYQGETQPGANLRPGDKEFENAVTDVLRTVGIDEQRAEKVVEQVVAEGKAVGIVAGAKAALDLAQARRPRTAKGKAEAVNVVGIELAPDDYRNALERSKADSKPVLEHLVAMGAACRLEQVLGLS